MPSRVLYVGDSYSCDVLGANNAGMVSAMLLRKDANSQHVSDSNVFSQQELSIEHSEVYPAAHIILRSLRVADLESAFNKYWEN